MLASSKPGSGCGREIGNSWHKVSKELHVIPEAARASGPSKFELRLCKPRFCFRPPFRYLRAKPHSASLSRAPCSHGGGGASPKTTAVNSQRVTSPPAAATFHSRTPTLTVNLPAKGKRFVNPALHCSPPPRLQLARLTRSNRRPCSPPLSG
jgi:hypothetical protein